MPTDDSLDGLPARRPPRFAALLVVAILETVSLAALLLNIAFGDNPHVARALGPTHGLLYLTGIALTWMSTPVWRVRVLAVVPVVGAALALTRLRPRRRVR